MNQTVQFHSPTFPVSFILEETVVKEVLSRATQSVNSGKDKTSSAYVNRLVKWALENYKDGTSKDEIRNDLAEQVPNS